MAYSYPQPHRFTRQKEPKNIQNSPELKEIGLISINFTKSVISPSVLVQKICFWACSKAHKYRYRNPYPYPAVPIPGARAGLPKPVPFPNPDPEALGTDLSSWTIGWVDLACSLPPCMKYDDEIIILKNNTELLQQVRT